MRFVFLSHWAVGRMATTERLAVALVRKGHEVLHAVAPVRNPARALRGSRAHPPLRSVQLWSPLAHRGSPTRFDSWVVSAELRWIVGTERLAGSTLVLQTPVLTRTARALSVARRIYAALDELPGIDSAPACEWADAVFCLSEHVRATLQHRHPARAIRNLGQCGRFADEFVSSPDPRPTVVYAGGAHPYVAREGLRAVARLEARLLLVGCDAADARSIFGGRVPDNVEPLGWLAGDAFARAIGRGWVGIVPYDPEHPRVVQSNPDKPYDYLLAGLTAIATPVPALAGVPGVLTVPPERLADAVGTALAAYGPDVRARQRAAGRLFAADAYADRFIEFLSATGGSAGAKA
jgi:hypothetical protein